jgi:DNA modification methylase
MPTAADVLAGAARWACDTGDVAEWLRSLPADSVHCCVTSPPYWGLRSYLPDGHPDKPREIGLEPTPAEYVEAMVAVFREVRRVLHPDGTLWLNMGDSYSSNDAQWDREGRVPALG